MKKKLGVIGGILALVAFGLIGWRVGAEIAKYGDNGVDIWKIVLFLLGFVVAFFIHIILHETGHLIGGLIGGYMFVSFCIGSLCLSKESGKLRVSMEKNKGIAGYCKMLPPKDVTKKSFVAHIMGGLIASLALTVISLALFLLLFFFDKRGYWFFFFCGTFPINAFIFFTNAAAVSANGAPTDGMLVQMMRKETPSAVATMKTLSLQGYLMGGASPQEIPETLISDMPVLSDDDSMSAVVYSNLFYYYLDRANEKKIFYYGKKIEDVLPYASDVYKADLMTSAFLTAIFEDNGTKAGTYYATLVQKKERADSMLLLALCYYEKLFLRKDIDALLTKTCEAAKNETVKCMGDTVLRYADWLKKL